MTQRRYGDHIKFTATEYGSVHLQSRVLFVDKYLNGGLMSAFLVSVLMEVPMFAAKSASEMFVFSYG